MQPDEALALAQLRRWGYERVRLHRGQAHAVKEYSSRPGWANRHSCSYDAALVRCIDFEKTLATLHPTEQILLVAHYRDREPMEHAAIAAGVSTRTAFTRCSQARQHLAAALDRKGLL